MGSVYLLLGTNLGSRLGFLLALSAFFGWCTIMGVIWWIYGTIGMLGEAPKWEVEEVVYTSGTADDSASRRRPRGGRTTSTPRRCPPPEELNELDERRRSRSSRDEVEPTLDGWQLLPESNPSFGEAKATVDEYFVEHPDEELGLDGAGRLRHRLLLRAGRQGRPARRPEPARPHRARSSRPRSGRSSTRRTTPSSRCSR